MSIDPAAWPFRCTLDDVQLDDGDYGLDHKSTAEVSGWDSAAPQRLTIASRVGQDGGWDAQSYAEPRSIIVEGTMEDSDPVRLLKLADDLAALTHRGLIPFTVDSARIGTRSAMVRVSNPADPEWISEQAFTYTIGLIAPDPRKYGTRVATMAELSGADSGAGLQFPLAFPLDFGVIEGQTPGAISLPNAGTTPYWPTLRIAGPISNPLVSMPETGDWLRVAYTLTAGQWLDVDLGARRVLLNGGDSLRRLTTFAGSWLAVPPGGASISFSADSGGSGSSLIAYGYEGAWL